MSAVDIRNAPGGPDHKSLLLRQEKAFDPGIIMSEEIFMIDTTDLRIINILQKNGKTSTREIGAEVGLTAPAVSERISRLKDQKVIRGIHADIDESKLGYNISAFVKINVPPRLYRSFCRFCEEDSAVVEHHHIVGLENALLRIRVENSHELEMLLERLRSFGLSNTSVMLSSYFSEKTFPVE